VTFIDSNVPMYLVGAPHPHKTRAIEIVDGLVRAGERLVTDVEVYQEILHRYTAIRRTDAIDAAFRSLDALADEEVVAHLTTVRGVGEWTAHMFLMSHLGRPDILPVGDLGVRAGMRVAYDLAALPTPARAREIGSPWAPYRSVGSWYMWQAAGTAPPR